MDEQEFEIDLTKVDRVAEYLDDSAVPVWFETEKSLEELYSADSLEKAVKLVENGKVVETGREGLYDIQGSELYVVNVIPLGDGDQVPGVTCTCPNGSNRSGRPTCYHSASALLVYLEVDLKTFRN